jgi:ligand-binding sensor domain-containing protein
MWFASMNGLFRHDGDRIAKVEIGSGAPNTRVLLAARNGGLWVASGGGSS